MIDFTKTFEGKVCVITGAASGIGRALTQALAQAGAVLVVSDIDAAGLDETVQLAGLTGSNRVLIDRLDVSNADDIAAYAPRVEAAIGPADYVFNVAGLSRVGDFENTPLTSVETVMNVNFYGVVRMTKAFLPQLRKTKGGLVNISSVFGLIGFPGQAHYCASKFAVRGFTETLAQEMQGTGVTVSCVHPGGVDTNVAANAVIDHLPEGGLSQEEKIEEFKKAAITSPERAAEIILMGTAKGKARILVGGDAKIIHIITRLFPVTYAKVLRKLRKDTYEITDKA